MTRTLETSFFTQPTNNTAGFLQSPPLLLRSSNHSTTQQNISHGTRDGRSWWSCNQKLTSDVGSEIFIAILFEYLIFLVLLLLLLLIYKMNGNNTKRTYRETRNDRRCDSTGKTLMCILITDIQNTIKTIRLSTEQSLHFIRTVYDVVNTL